MSWTDERVATLKRLRDEGLSASQIAASLGGVTRNAIIGKAHRIGLPLRGKPLKDSVGQSYRPKNMTRWQARASMLRSIAKSPVVSKNVRKAGGVDAWIKQHIEPPKAAPERLVVDEPTLVSYAQLEAHHCRYIPGEPAGERTMFCGKRKVDGQPSYCEEHAHRCNHAVQPIKPPAAWRDIPRTGTGISSRHALALVRG